MADKKSTTIRLGEKTHDQLRRAAYVLGCTQSKVVEDALHEFLRSRNLTGGYQLTFTNDNIVLLRTNQEKPPTVLEVAQRNGVSPDDVASKYTTKLGEPVHIVVQD